MDVMPNLITVALQVIPFLVACFALTKIIFFPMLDYLAERKQAIDGNRAEAAELHSRIQERTAEYEARLLAARQQVSELRAKARAEATDRYDAAISAARAEAEAEIAQAVVQINESKAVASGQLELTAQSLAGEIAGQVLGRAGAVG